VNGALKIRSILTNQGTKPITANWGSGLHLVGVGSGKLVFGSELPRVAELPDGIDKARIMDGAKCPENAYHLDVDECRLTHDYSRSPITRLIVARESSDNRLAMDIRTDRAPLKPGEKLTTKQLITIKVTP